MASVFPNGVRRYHGTATVVDLGLTIGHKPDCEVPCLAGRFRGLHGIQWLTHVG